MDTHGASAVPDVPLSASQSLITFVNKQLNKLNLEVTELETQVRGAPAALSPGAGGGERELLVPSLRTRLPPASSSRGRLGPERALS